jgi:hypothetical protein
MCRVRSLALTAMVRSDVHFPVACLEAWARLDVLVVPDSDRASSTTLCPSAKTSGRHMPLFATRALSRSMVLDSARWWGLVLTRLRTRRTVCLVRRVLLPWTLSRVPPAAAVGEALFPFARARPSSRPGAMGEMPVSLLIVVVCLVLSEAPWALGPGMGAPVGGSASMRK